MTSSHSFTFIVINHHHYRLTHVHLKHDRMECQQLHKYAYSTHNQNCNIMTNIMPKGKVRLPKKDPCRDLVHSFLTSKQRLFLKWSALIMLKYLQSALRCFSRPRIECCKMLYSRQACYGMCYSTDNFPSTSSTNILMKWDCIFSWLSQIKWHMWENTT